MDSSKLRGFSSGEDFGDVSVFSVATSCHCSVLSLLAVSVVSEQSCSRVPGGDLPAGHHMWGFQSLWKA